MTGVEIDPERIVLQMHSHVVGAVWWQEVGQVLARGVKEQTSDLHLQTWSADW